MWRLLDLDPDPELRIFALHRVLAHLGAGGATAGPDPEGRS